MPASLFLIGAFVLSGWVFNRMPQQDGSIEILDTSKLSLDVSSNVKDFSCDCDYEFGTRQFQFQTAEDGLSLTFANTGFYFPSKSLNCGHKGINKDMYETLKAEQYPHIDIKILEAKNQGHQATLSGSQWSSFRVKMQLTIANEKETLWIDVKGQAASKDSFRFIGTKDISLQTFCLEPPSPMMGLVKVDDCITIHFDLWVKLE
ncbi:MAG TPA: YceI family protein [Saprospiraceae bacterium]|nr:YceI family protein [Saprospiraceae bacterium]HMQ82944.1 YceI family protein [Saprospiraceae bacterium]